MKKLFNVTVSYDFVVEAEDDGDAFEVALQNLHNAIRDIPEKYIQILVDEGPYIWAHGWDGDCIPYGGDGNTRTKDYEGVTVYKDELNDVVAEQSKLK